MTFTDPEPLAMLAAIRAEPECDAPRLAFADWLQENAGSVECGRCEGEKNIWAAWEVKHQSAIYPGRKRVFCPTCSGSGRVPDGREAWAEFIRVQVELVRDYFEPNRLINQRFHNLHDRERELWKVVGDSFDIYGLQSRLPWESGIETEDEIVIVRRGFPAVVRCSLDAWRGGEECSTCRGRTVLPRPNRKRGDAHAIMCPACHGTGRTPGIGPRIVAEWPIERVEITDAVIHPSGGNMTYYLGGLGVFPAKYWRELESLPDQRAVRNALSRVCIAEARERAAVAATERELEELNR